MHNTSRTLELLDHLIAYPTVSQNSNLDLIVWAESHLRDWGFDVTRIWSPDRTKAGLFARIGPKVDGGICLSGHTDVVPVEGQHWTHPHFTLSHVGDRVYGRGSTDMKGFVASALAIAEQAGKHTLKAPLSLVLSYDEEIGCVGIREMLPQLTPLLGKPDLVIVGEPTSMQIAIGHKGKAALSVTCTGESGHSALAPNFVNAIHVASHFIAEIRALQSRLMQGTQDSAYDIPYSTVHVGTISGGRALNIVPDLVMLSMEYRHLHNTGPDILGDINAIAKRTAEAFAAPAAISIETLNTYPGLDVNIAHPVIDQTRQLTEKTGTIKVAFGTEAGFFAGLGLDTLVIGPGSMAADGHKPDEGLDLAELRACDTMMARVLEQLSA